MEQFVPFFFFFVVICITYIFKVVVDARTRHKIIAANRSDELLAGWLADERQLRRFALLRWGVVSSSLAVGFGLIEVAGWRDVSPGAIGILLGATGVGNLVCYLIERTLPQKDARSRMV